MDKCAKEIESIKMINDMKFKEKLKSIKDIDRYYKDKIAILNEIGRRERIEKKRSKMEDELIYLQLNSMPKRELKNKMKQILNSLDDEYYNNVEVDNNNQEEIEKILDNYYKNSGDWGLGIGDWGLGIGSNPQSPIPNPQSPIPNPHEVILILLINKKIILK